MFKEALATANKKENEEPEILKPSVTLFTWEAPERLFKTKSRSFYRRLAVIVIFFSLLALITKDVPMVLILGVSFFAVYVFHTIPPRNITHKITTRGIDYASEYLYTWESLVDFWIEKKEGKNILNLTTVNPLPGRLSLIIGDSVDIKKLTTGINKYLSINENPKEPSVNGAFTKIFSKISFD